MRIASCAGSMVPLPVRLLRGYHQVSFRTTGDPAQVLDYYRHDDEHVDNPPPNVRVAMQYAPWNPADANVVQGRYPISETNEMNSLMHHFGKVVGSEGMGRVVEIRGDDDNVSVGDWVVAGRPNLGTWRSSLWLPSDAVLKVSDELVQHAGPAAATLLQLGGTAWRMLTTFVQFPERSVVLQNAGNSGVGLLASQLAAVQGWNMVSCVRRGERSPAQMEQLVTHLLEMGKNARVVVQEDLDDKECFREVKASLAELSPYPPQLALNAVGGMSASQLLKLLGPGGTMVTYGGMSKQPVSVGTAQLIFQDVRLAGYWHSRWMSHASRAERQALLDTLVEHVVSGQVQCPPVRVFPLSDWKQALEYEAQQSNEAIRRKIVMDCREAE